MLSIIVPAFNEEQRLPATLVRMRAYLDGRDEEYEVLVVDDGSSDNTLAMSRDIAKEWPQLQVLALEQNTGKGAAVRLGMLSARVEHRGAQRRGSQRADRGGRAPARARLQGNCAVAIASRALPDSRIDVHQPGRREVMGRTYNRLLRVAALRGLHDTQCGFKAFTAEAAVALLPRHCARSASGSMPRCFPARSSSWAGRSRKCRCAGEHKEDSRVSAMRDSVGVLYDLVRLRFIVRR